MSSATIHACDRTDLPEQPSKYSLSPRLVVKAVSTRQAGSALLSQILLFQRTCQYVNRQATAQQVNKMLLEQSDLKCNSLQVMPVLLGQSASGLHAGPAGLGIPLAVYRSGPTH